MDLKKWDLSNVNLGNLTDDERREIHALMTRDQQEQNELGAGLVILYVCSIPRRPFPPSEKGRRIRIVDIPEYRANFIAENRKRKTAGLPLLKDCICATTTTELTSHRRPEMFDPSQFDLSK